MLSTLLGPPRGLVVTTSHLRPIPNDLRKPTAQKHGGLFFTDSDFLPSWGAWAVERVYYPGLASHPDHPVARDLMRGHGGVVSFLVRGDEATTSRFIDRCTLARVGPSLGGVESLIEQPALMSFYELTSEQRLALGIRDNLVRLSVGVEDPDDILHDLDHALAPEPSP
jgi:cystathionine beta-lyase/cystathionine gamma-synthase